MSLDFATLRPEKGLATLIKQGKEASRLWECAYSRGSCFLGGARALHVRVLIVFIVLVFVDPLNREHFFQRACLIHDPPLTDSNPHPR